jgi:ATP-dependent protease ClpP protease subunit
MNTQKIWRIKQSTKPKTLDIYIYGYVESDEDAKESKTSAEYFKKELAKHPDASNINLYVNSWGGSIFEGTAIQTQLKRHPAYVTGYVDGFACSIASYILTSCDKVIMPRNTMQFIHNIWTVSIGNAEELRKVADGLDQMMKANRQAYLDKSGGKITEKKLTELLDAETWLTAQECFEYGFCDEVIGKEVDLSEAKQMLQKVRKNHEPELQKNKKLAAQFDCLLGNSSKSELNKSQQLFLAGIDVQIDRFTGSFKAEMNSLKKLLLSNFK